MTKRTAPASIVASPSGGRVMRECMAPRIRAGSVYTFEPCSMDRMMPEHYSATAGQRVRVVNLPGAPRCGTIGQCHIEDAASGAFLGMVSVRSLARRPA